MIDISLRLFPRESSPENAPNVRERMKVMNINYIACIIAS